MTIITARLRECGGFNFEQKRQQENTFVGQIFAK